METVPPPDSAVVLNGWKEIASYLGRSARSAQRWERELGLPIRRIPTPDGGAIIYALATEVDAWRARRSGEIEADAAGNGVEEPPAAGVGADTHRRPVGSPTRARLRWWQTPVPAWAVLLCVIGTAVGADLLVNVATQAAGVVATWEYEGRSLRTFTAGGRLLWSHDFGRPVSHPVTFARGPGHVGDVDGDGVAESLVPIRYANSAREITKESDAVAAFAANGRLLWSVQPLLRLQANGEIFEGPWRVYDVMTGLTLHGPRTWIAFNHNTWWPGFVIEVDPAGRQRLLLVQSGWVFTLTYWPTASRSILVAGGSLREPTQTLAAAIMVDVDGPPAAWPQSGGSHLSCEACPMANPAAVLLFPTSHVTRALFRPSGYVNPGKAVAGGLQLPIRETFGAGTVVTVREDLTVAQYERTDQYWFVHRELESQGLITHVAEDCPDRRDAMVVRYWSDDAGWQTQEVPLRMSKAWPTAPN